MTGITDACYDVLDLESSASCEVFDVRDLRNLLSSIGESFPLQDETMTSLGALMLLSQSSSKSSQDLITTRRLSLAYERLRSVPKLLRDEFGPVVEILDVSNNELDDLMFLKEFPKLTSLICDRNNISSYSELPYIPKLELLWLNHCKINELYPWAQKLQQSCPNLKYLSLMGNLAAPSYLNGGNFYEYIQYRLFIISLFPQLVHLDDRVVSEYQRSEAQRLYKRPLLERIKPAIVPDCFRTLSGKINEMLAPAPEMFVTRERKRNAII